MTVVVAVVLAFAAGAAVGAFTAFRNIPRIIAALSPDERRALARKAVAVARQR